MQTKLRGFFLLFVAVMAALLAATKADPASQIALLQLAVSHFGQLSIAEERLVNAAANGETAYCTDLSGGDKNIRGDLLSWLCTNPQASAQITYRGISITGAEVDKKMDLEWAKVSFPITASQCVFTDAIVLSNSHIAFLSLEGSSVTDFKAKSTHFDGSVSLRKCRAKGGVNLASARIDGNLDCAGGEFVGYDKVPALNAHDAEIGGNVYLSNGFKAEGNIIFFGAYVGRAFRWFDVKSPEKVILDLRQAKVGTLLNSQDSWPTKGNLRVDGFVYDQIDGRTRPNDNDDQIDDRTPPNGKVQLGWLQLQPKDPFLSQRFEQLAAVLRKMGDDEDAKLVMITKNESEAKHIPLRFNRTGDWTWFQIIGPIIIGYGYRPWNAFVISLVVIGIGWWLFQRGYRRGLVTPTRETKYTVETDGAHPCSDDYPKFNAFVYSLETFVPLVKLGLGDHWTPNANRGQSLRLGIVSFPRTGGWLRGYLWFHIIAGWVLTTLWVGGLTGLVKT